RLRGGRPAGQPAGSSSTSATSGARPDRTDRVAVRISGLLVRRIVEWPRHHPGRHHGLLDLELLGGPDVGLKLGTELVVAGRDGGYRDVALADRRPEGRGHAAHLLVAGIEERVFRR